MKQTIIVLLVATLCEITRAEPPRDFDGYNYEKPTIAFVLPSRQQFPVVPQVSYGTPQRFSAPPQRVESLENTYGAPGNQYGAPENQFGAPVNQFGAPENQFGGNQYVPPENKYGSPPTELTPPEVLDVESREDGLTTTELPTTTETPQKEEIKDTEEIEESNKDEGIYYIYHPSGLLQRIVYSTNNDVRNMAYTAQFRYKDVEPIRDPVYTYDPETLVLRQIVA